MLETSIVGGAKTLPKNLGGSINYLQVSPPVLRRQPGAGGFGSEEDDVLSRHRTISGPEGLAGDQIDPLPRQPAQQRPEPRPRSTAASPASEITDGTATLRKRPPTDSEAPPPADANSAVTTPTGSDATRRRQSPADHTEGVVQTDNQSGSPGSQTDGGQNNGCDPLQQNGGVVLRRRPPSEASDRTEANRDSCEWMEARKSLKPPVSPKPSAVTARKAQADPPTPTRRVPIPGPDFTEMAQSPEAKPAPPVSPKPRGPPTAPKPGKATVGSAAMSPSPAATSPAACSPTPATKPSPPLCSGALPAPDASSSAPSLSPGLPLTSPSPAQSPSTPSPHPVKPPRSSIAGLSIDLLGAREVEEEEEEEEERRREREHKRHKEQKQQEEEERKKAEDENPRELESEVEEVEQGEEVQPRVEETSASLAAAVEHQIKKEDAQNDKKANVSILDDIGSMFDDLADQLDAMLD